MDKVFVEYKIKAEKRQDYLIFMEKVRQTARFRLYEGTDQPSLFVEVWEGLGEAEYRSLKSERAAEPGSPWQELGQYVDGGLGKVHIWHFKEVE